MALAIQTILERSRLFRSLPAPALQQITALAIRRNYREGVSVFSQGDPGDALYGVASGRIRISASGPDGREIFLNIMEPGDSFGEIALLDGAPRTANCDRERAVGAVRHQARCRSCCCCSVIPK